MRHELGAKYVDAIPFDLGACYEDSGPATPIFFLLSPGVDPVVSVKALGRARGFTEEGGRFSSVSLGQGQEPVAEKALERMHASGGWVMLQNIELVAAWLPKLEKKLEALSDGAHPDFRVLLSSLPQQVVPVQILHTHPCRSARPGSAPARVRVRPLCLLSARLAATCSSALRGWGPRPLGPQPRPRLLERAASKVAGSIAFDHPGRAP